MSLEFVTERTFEHNGIQLTAKEWGRSGYSPVIALHGWLDNANSFDRLLPHLENLHVIALDSAGHGRSSFRSADSGYDIWQDIGDVIAVADQMGWETFRLLGHSRGAVIATLVAGTIPQRVSHCLLIDGFPPIPDKPKSAAQQMARALYENRRFGAAAPTQFASFEQAVQARVNGFVPLQLAAATTLAERGVFEEGGSFYWRNDQRLKAASMIKFTADQYQDFLTAITCRMMLIRAEDSTLSNRHMQDNLTQWLPQLLIEPMQGSHHLHLEDTAQTVAAKVQSFLE